jgi:hypothetical protein
MNAIQFRRLWKQEKAAFAAAGRVLGPWEGSWISEPSGHRGRLRGVVRQVGDDRLQVAFHAVFWKAFWMTYEPSLEGRPIDDGYEIQGSWRLPGPFGGQFSYEGIVTPTEFRARYRASSDHGSFLMQRPA